MSNVRTLDLDAARREQEEPDGIRVVLRGEEYLLPAELPADVFDPLLSEDLDLAGLITVALGADGNVGKALTDALFTRPSLPRELIGAVHDCFKQLFGDADYQRLRASRPSFKDYGSLITGLFSLYGTSLGEAFASPDSSESDGATPKPTSASTTDSTPAPAGGDVEPSPAS